MWELPGGQRAAAQGGAYPWKKQGEGDFFQVLFGASPALTRWLLLLRALWGDRGEFGGDSLDIPRFPGHLPA